MGWQLEPWASLNDATGFHIGEGRWLRDRRFSDDDRKSEHGQSEDENDEEQDVGDGTGLMGE